MKRRWLEYRLPLFAKELIEEAQRPRTYVLRVAYAAGLFTLSLFFLYRLISRGGEVQVSALLRGHGVRLFNLVFWAQAAGIILFLPPMMADAITRERERSCLDLLVLTNLSPFDIILQKLLSRCLPLATCLTLSLPLLAVSMAYGGVTADMVWSAAYLLLLFCAQVGAISLYLSSDSPTASSALLSIVVRLPLHGLLLSGIGLVASAPVPLSGWSRLGTLLPPFLLAAGRAPPFYQTVLFTLPAATSIFYYLFASRDVLTRVAFTNPREPAGPGFMLAEVHFRKATHRVPDLPDLDPVAWLELSSELMAQIRQVFLVACFLNFPLILLVTGATESAMWQPAEGTQAFPWLLGGLWLLAAGTLALMAASTFVRERVGQTLDVLLTTPLETKRLLRDKLAAVRSCAWRMAAPLAIVCLIESLLEARRRYGSGPLLYLACSALTLAVYLPLALWLGAWIGLRVRNRARALLAVLGTLAVWIFAAPELVRMVIGASRAGALSHLYLLSPLTIVQLNETDSWERFSSASPWFTVAGNFAIYGGLLLWLRWWILRNADRLLGRIPEPA